MILGSITLPDNLYWQDEQDHKPFAQSKNRSVSGGLILEYQALQFGRPITLTGAWIDGAALSALTALEIQPTTKRVLTLNNGDQHTVQFDLERGGIQATPVWPTTEPDDTTLYEITLNLITVQPDAEPV
ncbi:MAG: hypothetical protein CMI09_11700 [Oceanospirillaceae bacterium]|nr:hypothetical protein [Oceanospirillaceae bacterium]|tara:strand:- start:502 stop:888 length:387 start_codon:yes stop_codon:yes gene_type:complete